MPTYDQFNPSLITRAATPEIISRGRSYFYSGRASVIACSRYRSVTTVRGSMPQPYTVVTRWSPAGAEAECNCTFAEGQIRLICKHKVAAALATEHYLRIHPKVSWQSLLDEAIGTAVKAPSKLAKSVLLFSLQQRYNNWAVYTYSLTPVHFDLETIDQSETVVKTVLDDQLSTKAKHVRTPLERARILNATEPLMIAADLCWAYQQASSYTWNMPQTVHRLIPFLRNCPLFVGTEESPLRTAVSIEQDAGRLELELLREEVGLRINPVILLPEGEQIRLQDTKAKFISSNPAWMLISDRLIQVDGSMGAVEPLLRSNDLIIPPDEIAEFSTGYLAQLAAKLPITGDGFQWEEVQLPATPRLYLKQNEAGEPIAELRFAYGKEIILGANPEKQQSTVIHVSKDQTFVRVVRDLEAEDRAEEAVRVHGLRKDHRNGEYALRAGTHVIGFLMHDIPHLMEAGFEIYGEENLTSTKINRHAPRMSMNVSSGIDWFDVQIGVTFGDATAPLKAIRQAIKKREKYVQLTDGSIGALPDEWIKKYSFFFSLGVEQSDESGAEELRLQKHHAILLGDILDDTDSFEADDQFQTILGRLKDFESIQQHPLPNSLEATLRPYQRHGFDWLHFLREYGAGGCIADDMGLGKTVQVLAFLQSLSERQAERKQASLVVVPRSLIFNWQREASKFTPSLQILVHADQARERSNEGFDEHDIVLTTYGILVRDIEFLRSHGFRCVVLDESQAIKNPAALSAKASRLLRADQRITLTGTPVENSTQDLWSQFAFLNPGLLGTIEQFRSQFGSAIDRGQDDDRAIGLRRLVHPFILRRTKEQVAPELPPRTERIVYTGMEPEQRKFYDETKSYYQNLLLGLIDREGIGKSRMKVLEGLLRLRQICNHPKLMDIGYEGPSSKFSGLIETLLTLQSEGHKALVFSQFVQMLKLVEKELTVLGVRFEMLTGQTRDRQERVDSFQQNADIPFFLISLKAGGVGLNLTAADYVIHIDPWWNPAVEMQATDRTHRIGQDKPVFIYKLIAEDTVEDKILQLQERKREMVKQVIATETGFFKSLTRDDIEGLFG